MRVTIDNVMSWKPCKEYTRERVEELFAGRKYVTAMDVLRMAIPAQDRLWAVLREEMVPAPVLHKFACRVAENALLRERRAGREPDPRSWAAIEAKRKWLRGEISNDELAAAEDAAGEAVWSAARDAAGFAAGEAAWFAAEEAAQEAAWFAAGNAAGDAAWNAVREEQCELLKKYVGGSRTCTKFLNSSGQPKGCWRRLNGRRG